MNSTGAGLRPATVLPVLAATALLLTGCGFVHISLGGGAASSTEPVSYQAELAYARCMQTHGVPGYPDPSSSGSGHVSTSRGTGHVAGSPTSPAERANAACEHLLTSATATATASATDTVGAAASAASSTPGSGPADCLDARPTCYTPAQLQVAYGIKPLLQRGLTGRGETIVLPEFPPAATGSSSTGDQVPTSSDIRQDLARFDRGFDLPAAQVRVVNSLAHAASPWQASPEEVEDTEIVHALAPDAAIREVLIPSSPTTSTAAVSAAVVAAVRLGLTQGGVISLSVGAGEQCFTAAEVAQWNSVLQAAERDRVTVVASLSDYGAATTACPPEAGAATVKGVDLPASDPLTLAVGGTTLHASEATGAYLGETAWNTSPSASGGGFSRLFSRPAYQDGVVTEATRGAPDVSADADPDTGMALAFSGNGSGSGSGYVYPAAGGTSAAAPLWAAVIALADQDAGRSLGFINPALYNIGRGASYHQAFHDVTSGNNTVAASTGYEAAPGWDPVTGWGSPNAQVLVPLLAR